MRRDTLLDFFDDITQLDGEFVVYDDGYRSRTYSYHDVGRAARAFARRLRNAGVTKGDRIVVWGENRPEWLVAFWGCLLVGAIVVPIDYRSSGAFLRRVQQVVEGRIVLAGDEVRLPEDGDATAVWRLAELLADDARTLEAPSADATRPPVALTRDDVAEIIFTSGATAEPKGVTITHRNILGNIVPIEREIAKYRKYARPFQPIRFLNVLPLSHMFGQAMATFVPPMLSGVVVFARGYNPSEIVRQIKSRRISVLVCVPKLLDVLRDHVRRLVPEAMEVPARRLHWIVRWWRYRRAHRIFGWKFWSVVVGAAPLEPELEEFWARLGFVVVQGYGLTETAPIVTLNHPLKTAKGTVGKPIAGVEVKIASDGEILVRGENVTTGYYKAPAATAEAFENGWFHTGDIGTVDAEGRLSIRGRKKEMIVTPQGLNVFPEDVERVLNEQPGVVESAVVGVREGGEERVHAVLVVEPAADLDQLLRRANARLDEHQRVRAASAWIDGPLPRTEGTRKLRRRELARWAAGGVATVDRPAVSGVRLEEVVARFAGARTIHDDTTLDELGLSSLERVELMMALEANFQSTIDESAFAAARTVAELRAIVGDQGLGALGGGPPIEPIAFPAWTRSAPARAIRRASLPTWILPVARVFAWVRVEGLENLAGTQRPVVFAANHQSHMDTPAILLSLPARWRYRVAPAMAKEFFKAHFHPEPHSRRERFTNSLNYYLASLFFNAFPLPQREAGTRQALRYIGDLLEAGYSVLIFPEGRRTERGEIGPFRPGVGMIAARLGVPVVPVRLEGLDRVLPLGARVARPGRVRVAFGTPMSLTGDDYVALARQIEEAIRAL